MVDADAPDAQFGYPVTLDLHHVAVLVVGAGPVAARKVDGLAAAGAVVHVVAPQTSPEMDQRVDDGAVAEVRRRDYESADLVGMQLVLTATGNDTDARVAADAASAGLWVNAADRREHCTFILPAIARNGPLSIAISTDGSSPALAGALRDRTRPLVADPVVDLARRLADRRAAIRAAGESTEDRDWKPEIDAALDAATSGDPPNAR